MIQPPRFLGIIEGFYGRCWSREARLAWVGFLGRLGLNSYIYAPKADPWLRRQWQDDWPEAEWRALGELAGRCAGQGVSFGVGLSPFALYRDYGAAQQRRLRDRIGRINELGAPLLAILFDDMPGDCPDLARRQAAIIADVRAASRARHLFVCPTYYSFDPVLERHFGSRPPGYWAELGERLPDAVELFWTGPRVCSPALSQSDQAQAAQALGRPVVLWDNYPVNDGAQRSSQLYLDPLPAREAAPPTITRGHFCNPMNQAWCSLPGVAGLARLYGTLGEGDLEALLAELLGDAVYRRLQQHAALFREQGLAGMPGDLRNQLADEYRQLPGPAAAEVVEWLEGGYAFDPACLTD